MEWMILFIVKTSVRYHLKNVGDVQHNRYTVLLYNLPIIDTSTID